MRLIKRLALSFVRVFKSLLIACALLSVCGQSLMAASDDPSKVKLLLVTEESYPLNYLFTHGNRKEVVGYATELLETILVEANIDYQKQLMPWSRAYKKATTEPNVLIYSIGRLPAREPLFYWIGEIVKINYHLYALSNRINELPDQLDQLKQAKVAVIKSDLNHQYMLENGFSNMVYVNDYSQMNNLMLSERVDFFASSIIGIYFFAKRYNHKLKDFSSVHSFEDFDVSLYFALSKATDESVAKRLTAAYQKVVDSGEFEQIMQPFVSQQTTAIKLKQE
jgi:polar amino acid transport system substrate-binding protein